MSTWNEQIGPDSDVVISSRVRFARNVAGYPFIHTAGNEILEQVRSHVSHAVREMQSSLGLTVVNLKDTTLIDRYCLVETHLMSPDLLEGTRPAGLILNQDESLSVMVNEEDHLRIQAILPGLQMETAYKLCNDFEVRLGKKVRYAFDEKLGYLTSCPTNIGTGLRVSAMMHLPALVQSGMLKKILEACGKMGVAVRGVYGENSGAEGNIFQISNQVTLGHTEEEIIESMVHIINQIIEKERNLRQRILTGNKIGLEDKVFRSYGLLSNARSISCEEAMDLMSWVRLGIDLNLIDFINPVNMNLLLVQMQPGNIQKEAGTELTAQVRDEKRAVLCRKMMERETLKG